MPGLTDAERRGARVLAVLLVLGTLTDLWRARHPERTIPPPIRAQAEPAAEPTRPGAPAVRTPRLVSLDLNTATAAELDVLPGIGPVLAARIVDHRRRHGAFHAVEELLTVPGIGPRLLERLRPSLRDPPR